MEELYRGYRIAIKCDGRWMARITHVRGQLLPARAQSSLAEGEEACAARARRQIDDYIAFLDLPEPEPED